MKKCKICRKQFEPRYSSLQPTCNEPKCMAEYGRLNRDKFVKSEIKQLKEKTLDRKYYLKLAQTTFNTYIRLRDNNEGCISCGTKANIKYDAGHFWNVGNNPAVRFDEDNNHKQCSKNCNTSLSGNLLEYRERLIAKIGQERFDALNERRNHVKKWTIEELKEIIQTYRNKIKTITK